MFSKIIFGERIKALRTQRKLSQQELGDVINVTNTQISDIEKGKTSTTIEKAQLLADFFGVSLDYLVSNDELEESTSIGESSGGYSTLPKEESLSDEDKKILSVFKQLNEINKGRIIERSQIFLEEQATLNKKDAN